MTLATKEKVQVDPGGVRGGLVLIVAFGTALMMGLGVALAWEIQRVSVSSSPAPLAGRFGAPPAQLDAIEMSLFARGEPPRGGDTERRAPPSVNEGTDAVSAAREHLGAYGWSDREHGRVFIPIARAMQLYLARQARDAAPGTAPVAAPQALGGQP